MERLKKNMIQTKELQLTFEKSYTSVIWYLSIHTKTCIRVYQCTYVYCLDVFPILGDISCL